MLFSISAFAQIKDWESSGCMVDGVPTLKCLEVVFGNILFMASAFIIFVLFIMFVVGAFNYLTSFGDEKKVKTAQGTIKYAILGTVIFLASYLILTLIDTIFLGGHGKIFRFEIGPTLTP